MCNVSLFTLLTDRRIDGVAYLVSELMSTATNSLTLSSISPLHMFTMSARVCLVQS